MSWVYLTLAIAFEIGATLSMRASDGLRDKRWLPAVGGGYLASLVLLSFALRAGIPVGIAYGVWAAGGIALTAVLARLIFKDPLTRKMSLGVLLAMVGVLAVEMGATH